MDIITINLYENQLAFFNKMKLLKKFHSRSEGIRLALDIAIPIIIDNFFLIKEVINDEKYENKDLSNIKEKAITIIKGTEYYLKNMSGK